MSVAADIERISSVGPGKRGWTIPPLVRAGASGGELPQGSRLGQRVVDHLRGVDVHCEIYLVVDPVDGSSHMARVARRCVIAEHPALAESMLDSARVLAGHRDRHLLAVIDSGWTDEAAPRPYVVYERLVGRDLATYQARHGSLEPALLLAIAVQCAAALDALHRVGLAHTDLRRGCVMLVPIDGDRFQIMLGGFELAHPIRPGATAGDEPMVAEDLAALGVLLRELAAGLGDEAVSAAIARTCAWLGGRGPQPASAAEVKAALAEIQAELAASTLVGNLGDPGESAADLADAVPHVALRATSQDWRAPEFGQLSLEMPIERAADPIRIAATAWVTGGIVLMSLVAALLASVFGGPNILPTLAARSLEVAPDEPEVELAAPRTVPELARVAMPLGIDLQRTFMAQGRCDEKATVHSPAPARRKPERSVEPAGAMLPVAPAVAPTAAVEPPVAAEQSGPASAAEPAKPEQEREDDGLGLLPVGSASANAAERAAGPFLPAG